MEASKIILSEAERRLITDAEIILTKNAIIDKVVALFGVLAVNYQAASEHLRQSHRHLFDVYPKISKGEKHKGLPWVMLDYPRSFDKQQGHFAIRSFFWWGNYFSIRLQLSGAYLLPAINALQHWNADNWLSGLATDAWDLELPNNNWQPIPSAAIKANSGLVLKLAKKIPIEEWESVIGSFTNDFKTLLLLLEGILSAESVK